MSDRGEPASPSYFQYAVLGAVLGAIAFIVGESLRTEPIALTSGRRLHTAIAFALAGGVASAVHKRLRSLGWRSVAGHYSRWVATATSAAVVVGLNEFLVERSVAALAPVAFFGLAGGVGIGVLDRYVRQALR